VPKEDALPLFADTFYPNSPDVEGAIKVVVQNFDVSSLRIKLQPAECFSIRGTLRQAPKEAVTVRLVPIYSNGGMVAQSDPPMIESRVLSSSLDEDGAFELNDVLPGNYMVQASFLDSKTFDAKSKKWIFIGGTPCPSARPRYRPAVR
jgi:hypothetical protein